MIGARVVRLHFPFEFKIHLLGSSPQAGLLTPARETMPLQILGYFLNLYMEENKFSL